MKLSFIYDETSIIPNFATNSDAMKVTLDLDQLKNEGRITAEEYNRLRKFAAEATVSLALNLFLAIGIAARPVKSFAASAFVIVNLAFWIGSLWGDRSRFVGESAMVFVVTWALFLVFLVAWAAFTHRRWVVTTGTVFAVIHLYTQWFERLSLSPGSVMLAGILVIFIAAGLITYLRRPSVEIGG
jgi:hypothetical protein